MVGIERDWPGKVLAKDPRRTTNPPKIYTDLTPRQKELIDSYIADYNRKDGLQGYAGRRLCSAQQL